MAASSGFSSMVTCVAVPAECGLELLIRKRAVPAHRPCMPAILSIWPESPSPSNVTVTRVMCAADSDREKRVPVELPGLGKRLAVLRDGFHDFFHIDHRRYSFVASCGKAAIGLASANLEAGGMSDGATGKFGYARGMPEAAGEIFHCGGCAARYFAGRSERAGRSITEHQLGLLRKTRRQRKD
jgi:hypothetical protein